MPKKVDHDERRAAIAEALWDVAVERGLAAASFREVAAAAGVSVALVQHYFGTKHELVRWSLNRITVLAGARMAARVAALGPAAPARETVAVVLGGFLPLDAERRRTMTVYHLFAGAAVADPELAAADFYDGYRDLVGVLGLLVGDGDEARGLVAMVLGLSLGVLLDQMSGAEAQAIVGRHVDRLLPPG
jgi:AcrR family transcriptional regulator